MNLSYVPKPNLEAAILNRINQKLLRVGSSNFNKKFLLVTGNYERRIFSLIYRHMSLIEESKRFFFIPALNSKFLHIIESQTGNPELLV